jgi:dTDP-4-amino-4,6-dideoxygalactose transaminase
MRRLAPVRRAVPLLAPRGPAASDVLRHHFPGFDVHFFTSGTASLAAALSDAKLRLQRSQPEAIVPAYGCPDLVAACLYAGVYPRLVDVEPNSWGYRVTDLHKAISGRTIAVIAVNLLGVGDQSSELSALTRQHGIVLIQDSAQYLPDRNEAAWPGEYIVLSFGRGKPLNLMQGGALLTKPDRASSIATFDTGLRGIAMAKSRMLSGIAAAALFNTLTHPQIYGVASRLPGLGVGQTRYRALAACARLPERFAAAMAGAFAEYAQQANYRADVWTDALQRWEAAGIGELRCTAERQQDERQRLRLPLMAATQALRDRIVRRLHHAGLGASAMYERALPRIAGVPAQVSQQGPFPGAASLADRLFTLPTHALVDEAAVHSTQRLIMETVGAV